jgi:hypothetical protein
MTILIVLALAYGAGHLFGGLICRVVEGMIHGWRHL